MRPPLRRSSAERRPRSSPQTSACGRGERRAAGVSYAASERNGVRSGSISTASPRSRATRTKPRTSMSSTMPRSPAQRPGIVFRIANELDPRTDGHTRTNAGRKEACADGIHGPLIGFDGRRLDPATRGSAQENELARRSRGLSAGRSELDGLGSARRHRRTRGRRAHDEPGPRRAREGRSSARRRSPDWLGAVSRKLVHHDATPEERLEQLLAERRRELEEHAGRFESAVSDLGRREELVRDARTSVERALRVGSADLDAREADLADLASRADEARGADPRGGGLPRRPAERAGSRRAEARRRRAARAGPRRP